jgi:hypothetical protein
VTTGALPAPVRRYVRRPLWWGALALAAAGVGLVTDVEAAGRERASRRGALAVAGSVSERYRGGPDVPVTYENPVTGQHLEVTVRVFDRHLLAGSGRPVALLVDPDDPDHVAVAGDRYPTAMDFWWYAPPVAVPLVAAAARSLSVRRTGGMVDAAATTFAMTAALGAASRSGRRCRLDVYPLDAPAGAPPMCAVRVLTTGGAPLGPPFPVEVKGGPRPMGRIVARRGDRLLWPAGRAALSASAPRPADPVALPPPAVAVPVAATGEPLAWWRSVPLELLALGASVVLSGLVTLVTLTNAGPARAVEREGEPVLARIVARDDAAGVVRVAYRLSGEEVERQGTAAVDFPTRHPVGRLFPARVDPRDPATVRLLKERYEAREPILWSLVPVAVAVAVLARRRLEWSAVRRTASSRPWRTVDGRVLQQGPRHASVGLSPRGDAFVRCVVRVVADDARPLATAPVVVLDAAGELEPGEWVAVRSGDRPLAVVGPATALPDHR